MPIPEPQHHELYRRYWLEYKSAYDDVERVQLGRLMDEQQDKFGKDEFDRFKVTLPGYMEFWGTYPDRILHELERRLRENQTPSDPPLLG